MQQPSSIPYLIKEGSFAPCNCCGMDRISRKPSTTTKRGIKIMEGTVGKAGLSKYKKNFITHVQTKNGPITIVSRVEKF